MTRVARFAPPRSAHDCLAGVAIAIGAEAPEADLHALSEAAQALGIPVNIVDRPALSSFIMPALVDRDPLTIAIASGGAAPVLARQLRAKIEALIPPAYGRLAAFLGRAQGELRRRFPDLAQRRRLIERLRGGRVAALVFAGREAEAEAALAAELAASDSGTGADGADGAGGKIISLIPDDERILTIEEAAELRPEQPNVVTLISDRESDARSADALLTSTLRMRPDRIVLGEVRGKEAMTFLEAINTGHGGSLTTLHAETPQLAVRRLAIAALKTDLPMTYADMITYIEGSIDVIIQAGRREGARGITEFYLPGIGPDEAPSRLAAE
ncbi:MAG: ATPase, T2SS/T4P/T4SS family [Pseudodonghicola sp.]